MSEQNRCGVRWLAGALLLGLGVVPAACEQGLGSNVGPALAPLPFGSFRATVRDDQDRAVVGALVSVEGVGRELATRRSGRVEYFGVPSGRRAISISGTNGSAVATSRLGSLTVAVDLEANGEIPFEVFLPDISGSGGLALSPGLQGGSATLNDLGVTGVQLQLQAGTTVGTADGAPVELHTGSLSEAQLPPGLPVMAPVLANHGAYVGPPGVTFSPAADLTVTNTGGWPAGTMLSVLRLDPDTGEWTDLGTGTVDAGGATITAAGAVDRAALYAFAGTASAGATIDLRVLDLTVGSPIPEVLVRAGSVAGVTSVVDGRISLTDVAAVDGAGVDRVLPVRVAGGRDWWPVSTSESAALSSGAAIDLGDVVLDTFPVADVRVLMVERGRVYPRQNLGLTGVDRNLRAELSISAPDGSVAFDDAHRGIVGFYGSEPLNRDNTYVSSGQGAIAFTRSQIELQSFPVVIPWLAFGRSTQVYVCDALSGGALTQVGVAAGFNPGGGLLVPTGLNGLTGTGYGAGDYLVGATQTTGDGRTVTMAQSLVQPGNGRVELPLERALRDPIGAFDAHGLLAGQLTGSVGSGAFRLRTTRRITGRDWLHSVWLGAGLTGDLPLRIDPATAGTTPFEVGVAVPAGNIAAAEGIDSGGAFTWTRAGLVRDLAVPAGTRRVQDLDLELAVDDVTTVPGALAGLVSGLPVTGLRMDVAARFPDGAVVDLVRDVAGNHAALGTDLQLTLPGRTGPLTDAELWASLSGSSTSAGVTTDQQLMVRLPRDAAGGFGLLDAPVITSPTPGASVDPAALTVDFALPPDALYGELRITSTQGNETNTWSVVVPQTLTSFTFIEPPPEIPNPLVGGRVWTLSLSAVRVLDGSQLGGATTLPYRQIVGHWRGIGLDEQQATARTTVSFQVLSI